MRSYAGTAPLYASFPAHWLTGDRAILCMCKICSDPEFMHSVRQRYDALATMVTPAALLAPTSSPSSYPPSTSSTLPGISQSHLHGHHSLDSVAEIVVAAASATMPNVVRDDWHRGRPERAIYSKESAMVRLCINFIPIGFQPFSVVVFFLLASISSMRRIPEVYIHLLGVQCLISHSDGLAGYTFPLYQITTPEPVHASCPLDPTHCPKLS